YTSCGRWCCRRRRRCCRSCCWRRARAAQRAAIHAHGEVDVAGAELGIGSGMEEEPKRVASEERVIVVATRQAYAVGPDRGRIIRNLRAVTDRLDTEPIRAWSQV